jgi:DNA-binding MarR family transcriptional regulator
MPENPSSSGLEPRRLPPLLRRAWYSLNQTFRHRVAHLGITPDQYSVLRWLYEGDARGLTQQTLTDLMASDPNTITSILQRMEKVGLISRHPHETDKRARRVRLESKGRDVFAAGLCVAKILQAQVLEVLPESRRAVFLRDLERIGDACIAAHSQKPGTSLASDCAAAMSDTAFANPPPAAESSAISENEDPRKQPPSNSERKRARR